MPFIVRALVFIAWAGAKRFYPGRTSCHPLLHCTGLEPRRLSDLSRTVSLRLVTSQPMLLNTCTIEGLTLPAGFLVAETGRAAAGRMGTCAGATGYHLSHRVCIELSRSGSRTGSDRIEGAFAVSSAHNVFVLYQAVIRLSSSAIKTAN